MPKTTQQTKPKKPHPDFPLTANGNGQWSKKIRGRIHYFGLWADPEGALKRYLDQKDDLLAGRKPKTRDGLTITDLCNHFLTHKHQLLESGELAPRTFDRYHNTASLLIALLGKTRLVEDLQPEDFQALRGQMAKRWGPVALGNEIQIVRSIFRYADEAGLIEKRIRFGPGFKKPSAKTLRQTRTAGGPKLFRPEEIRALLESASPNLRAMILLGINGGLGNTDLGLLPSKAIDLESGWMDYPRPKTGMPRRIPLWPETVKAIREVVANRPEPKDPADKPLLFIGPRGQNYIGNHKGYRVTAEMTKLLKLAGIEGRAFYDLRRTFQTIAEGAHDLVAVQSIMGHAPASGDMSAIYRQRIEDDRLRVVVDHVRQWVFSANKNQPE